MYLKRTKKLLTTLLSVLMLLTVIPAGTAVGAAVVNEWSVEITEPENNFRFGVMSDTHADWTRMGKVLEAYAKVGGVDALALVGDIAYNSSTSANPSVPDDLYDGLTGLMTDYGYDVPDSNNAVDSGKLPMVYSLGNHEFPLNDSDTDIAAQSKALYVDKLGIPDTEKDGNWSAEIGGYTFIMPCAKDYFGNYTSAEEWVLSEIEAAEAKNDTKPIFYLQHHGISTSYNSAEFIEELKNHPRVIAITAHAHHVANDTTRINQNGYMSVMLPRVSGGNVNAQGGLYEMNLMEDASSVAYLFDVTTAAEGADTVTIYRMDILSGKLMGNPYVFTVGAESNYTSARYSMDKSKAAFAEGDALTVASVSSDSRDMTVSFPAENITIEGGTDVLLLEDNFVFGYKVILKEKTTSVIQQQKMVFGDFWRSEQFTPAKTRSLTLTDLERATDYVVSVYPLTTYQKNMTEEELIAEGAEAISAEFTSSYLKTDEDKALISTKLVNVALRKPITTENLTESSSYPISRIVDGNDTNRMNFAAAATGKASVIIDLKKRYNIDSIELITNGSTVYETFGFTFYGSNTSDFTDATVLGTSGTYYDGDVLAQGGTYTKDVTAEKDFRYIKMERNMSAGDSVAYKELKIWAEQDVTEVSRKKTVTASSANSSYPASKAVDGKNSAAGDAWVSTSGAGYHNITVDLGSLKHVGLIEIEARLGDGNANTSHEWRPYGSTAYVANSELSASSTVPETYTALSGATSNTAAGTLYLPSGYNKTEAPKVSLMTDSDETPYRFITIFNSNQTNYAKSLGEVRAFVLNPMVNRIERAGNVYTVYFSDVMDAETLTGDNIKAYSSSAEEQDVTITPSEDGYSVSIEADGINGGTIVVSDAVTNTYGVDMAEPLTYTIENTTTSYEGLPTKTVELNVAQYKPVSIGNGTENASYPPSNITDGNRETFADFTYSNEITIDLMRRYDVKRIELYARHNYESQSWCSNFKVYGSNDEDFTDKTELLNYGAYDATLFPTKGSYSFDVAGDEVYRYIKVEYPSSTTWLGYGDIRVFADVDVTQVTKKGMAVTAYPVKSSYPGSNLIDGSNSTFVYPGTGNYAFFSIDMGEAYPIGMIEMDSRNDGGDSYSAQYGIATYGSNELMADADNAAKSKLTATDGYTKLTWIQPTGNFSSYDATNPDMQFKRYSVNTTEYPCYREGFADENSYRYLTIKDEETSNCYQASEVRAYVINPMITGISVDGNKVTVGFSDPMIASLMTTENIVLKYGETTVSVTNAALSEDGYEFSFEAELIPMGAYTVEVSKSVRSKNGVTMQSDEILSFTAPAGVKIVDAEGKAVTTLENNTTYTVAVGITAEAGDKLVFYAAGKEKSTKELNWVVPSNTTAETTSVSHTFTFTTGDSVSTEYIEIFIWEADTLRPKCVQSVFYK